MEPAEIRAAEERLDQLALDIIRDPDAGDVDLCGATQWLCGGTWARGQVARQAVLAQHEGGAAPRIIEHIGRTR